MAHRENDNRGDELHRQNESFLRDRIKTLEARVKELEEKLQDIQPVEVKDDKLLTGHHNARVMEDLKWRALRGGWGNG